MSIVALAGCSSYDVKQPTDGSIVVLPDATRVVLKGSPGIAGGVQVTVDGTDHSSQMSYNQATGEYEGALALPAGRHRISAAADAKCWYCSGGTYRPSQDRTICVVASMPSTAASKTPLEEANASLSWASRSDRSVSVAPDSGNTTRWAVRNNTSNQFEVDSVPWF